MNSEDVRTIYHPPVLAAMMHYFVYFSFNQQKSLAAKPGWDQQQTILLKKLLL